MASVNKVILVGNLGKDPETRYFPSGGSVCNFSIATTEKWKDKQSGEQKEETTWHNIVANGRLGEIAQEYLKKGSPVYIEGRIRTRSYEKDGQTRYITEVIANGLQLLGSRSGGNADFSRDDDEPPATSSGKKAAAPKKAGASFDDLDDDIPF